MKLPRRLYALFLVLLPISASGLVGVGLTRWVAGELEVKTLDQDLRREINRVEVLRSQQGRESTQEDIPRLPEDPGVAEFLSQIEVAVGIAGITCDQINVPKGQEPGQQVYEIRGKGEAGQIARFFAILEADARLPILDEVRVFAGREERTGFELDLILFHKIGVRNR